ncbi:MAG: glycosyltransferase family 9 protein, partial [Candidatus Omnitrophica bacterium]|nr:glycosyltransferase family 9 protein [Candidatus Omnitrophota bacterium]
IFEKDEFRNELKRSKIAFIKKIYDFIKRIRLKKYGLVVDLSLGYQLSLLTKVLGTKKRIGFNFRNRGRFLSSKLEIGGFDDKHVIEYYLDLLRLIGITDRYETELDLAVSSKLEKWADNCISENILLGKRLIGLAPGGGKSWGQDASYRRWEPENFSYVARSLLDKREDLFFLIFGAGDEVGLCNLIEKGLTGRVINLCGKLLLPQSIALIKKCELILCNNGSILHIAASQKVKTVSIFGPVDDRVYGPYPPSPRNKVVVADRVKCRPCYKSFKYTTCQTHECLKEIDREKVLKLMEKSLNS